MAIAYPLNTPTNIGIASIAFTAENAVAISQSPFTYAQQVVSHPGQRWGASVSLPPMKRQDAEYWVAFLLSLKGQAGTFLLGDPNCVSPQGTAVPRKNLLTYTEQFNGATWATFGTVVVTPNSVLSPTGQMTADTLAISSASGIYQIVFASSFTTYTASVWVRANSNTTGTLIVNTNLGDAVYLSINVTTAWQRVSLSKTTQTGTNIVSIQLDATYGANTIYAWGAQLEVGSTATSYQGVVVDYGPYVNGANQTGGTLNIDGISPSVAEYFLPGDYIQLGAASTATLHKVLTVTSSDALGQAALDIWPNIRTAPADNAPLTLANTKGRFRLKENITQWQINDISSYGITFDCVEAI